MGHIYIKIPNEELYFVYSTVVDAPVTYAMSLEQLKEYIGDQAAEQAIRSFEQYSLPYVEKFGSSSRESPEDTIRHNRAGRKEKELSFKQIIEMVKK